MGALAVLLVSVAQAVMPFRVGVEAEVGTAVAPRDRQAMVTTVALVAMAATIRREQVTALERPGQELMPQMVAAEAEAVVTAMLSEATLARERNGTRRTVAVVVCRF